MNPDGTLKFVPSQASRFFGGGGFAVMGLMPALVALWAIDGTRRARGGSEWLCREFGERASEFETCKPKRGDDLEALAVLPALMAAGCLLAAAFLLWRAFTSEEIYTLDRGSNSFSLNGAVIARLDEISAVAGNRYGRAYALDVLHAGGEKTRLNTYLSAGEANDEAARIGQYVGVPARKRGWFFQTEE